MSFVKKILPNNVFIYVVSLRDKINFYSLAIAKQNLFFSWCSLITDKRYLLQHHSFLKGSYKYQKAVESKQNNLYFLRRNIHRLEKGLTMKPLRKEFGLRFILPTVQSFLSNLNIKGFVSGSEYHWASGVLTQYFKLTTSLDPRYCQAELEFSQFFESKLSGIELDEIPLTYNNTSKIEHFNALNQLLVQRKSVRRYSSQSVSHESITLALKMASLSPSSCNRQPYRYELVVNEKKASLIAKISAGTVGWSQNVNSIAVLIGDLSAFASVANRHSIYVDGTLSVMPFILGLEAQGLSTCIINWSDIPEKNLQMQEILGLQEYEKVVLSIAIGYSETDLLVPYSKRKQVNEISKIAG
jgi:nitroreductase